MEKFILERTYYLVDERFPYEQAGFRKLHLTADQVAPLTQDIEYAFDDKQILRAVFLDLTAAYDIWHKDLCHKLPMCLTGLCVG